MTDKDRQDAAVAISMSDRARSLDSLLAVERAAGAPGPARAEEWRAGLLSTLDELAASLAEQHATSASDEGLLGQVTRDAPHLIPGVEELRELHRRLNDRIGDLRTRLADYSRTVDVAATRHELAEMTAILRELRAWETDIVYEAYSVDLGVGD